MGVQVCEGVRATQVRVHRGEVEGVGTDEGFIASKNVVNAAGPWAIEVGRWVGLEIPIINCMRSIVVTGPVPEVPSDRPFVEDTAAEWYYRPEGPGILMGMGKEPTDQFEVGFRMEVAERMIEVAVHRVPVLEKASMLTGWTGVRPLTPDDRPMLGPVTAVSGFVLNCGWGGTGIIQAPMAGQLVAEHVADGRASTMDISPFLIDRFEERQSERS
jgi:sarcosine oxidase subunit beta